MLEPSESGLCGVAAGSKAGGEFKKAAAGEVMAGIGGIDRKGGGGRNLLSEASYRSPESCVLISPAIRQGSSVTSSDDTGAGRVVGGAENGF